MEVSRNHLTFGIDTFGRGEGGGEGEGGSLIILDLNLVSVDGVHFRARRLTTSFLSAKLSLLACVCRTLLFEAHERRLM